MNDQSAQLDRIEALLVEANRLRGETLSLQRESLAAQRKAMEEARENLKLAESVNLRALALQTAGRRVLMLLLPLILILIGYVSWLLFFKVGIRG